MPDPSFVLLCSLNVRHKIMKMHSRTFVECVSDMNRYDCDANGDKPIVEWFGEEWKAFRCCCCGVVSGS